MLISHLPDFDGMILGRSLNVTSKMGSTADIMKSQSVKPFICKPINTNLDFIHCIELQSKVQRVEYICYSQAYVTCQLPWIIKDPT